MKKPAEIVEQDAKEVEEAIQMVGESDAEVLVKKDEKRAEKMRRGVETKE